MKNFNKICDTLKIQTMIAICQEDLKSKNKKKVNISYDIRLRFDVTNLSNIYINYSLRKKLKLMKQLILKNDTFRF